MHDVNINRAQHRIALMTFGNGMWRDGVEPSLIKVVRTSISDMSPDSDSLGSGDPIASIRDPEPGLLTSLEKSSDTGSRRF